MKYLFLVLALFSAFTLGLYCSSQFIFGKPIEFNRWLMTSGCLLMWLLFLKYKLDKEKNQYGKEEKISF